MIWFYTNINTNANANKKTNIKYMVNGGHVQEKTLVNLGVPGGAHQLGGCHFNFEIWQTLPID